VLGCCPAGFQTYATFHLDTIRKILNHLLAVLVVCDLFLFFASWRVWLGTDAHGLRVVSVSFLLLVQTLAVYMIVNNNTSHHHHQPGGGSSLGPMGGGGGGNGGGILASLVPTDFMLGVALGITVGGSILAFVLSSAFSRPPWPCDGHSYSSSSALRGSSTSNSPTTHPAAGNQTSSSPSSASSSGGDMMDSVTYRCHQLYAQGSGASLSLWFWSSLVFWFNFCASLLLAAGRRDLSLSSPYSYEHIGGVDEVGGGGGTFPGDMAHNLPPGAVGPPPAPAPSPSFVGDYARIPEIRTEAGASPPVPSSEKTRIVVSL
jgi:hypothetical protein